MSALGTPLTLASGDSLAEAAVIVAYLEEKHTADGSAQGAPLLPPTPLAKARMQMLVQTHDLYLASPNSRQQHGGLNAHNVGCLFLPPWTAGDAAKRPTRSLDAPTAVRALDGQSAL